MPSSLPSSIPDTQLGLSVAEIQLLRRHQEVALSQSSLPTPSHSHYAQSTASSRGRGTTRVSNASSRAASASSHAGGGGRLLLDPGSLAVLGSHFERLMGAIQNKVDSVCCPHLTMTSRPLRYHLRRIPESRNAHANSSPSLPDS